MVQKAALANYRYSVRIMKDDYCSAERRSYVNGEDEDGDDADEYDDDNHDNGDDAGDDDDNDDGNDDGNEDDDGDDGHDNDDHGDGDCRPFLQLSGDIRSRKALAGRQCNKPIVNCESIGHTHF